MSEGFFSGQFCITIIMIVQLQCVNKFCAVFLIVAYQLEQSGLTADTVLTKENYEDIVKVFMDNWDIVVKRFEHSNKAAEEYYMNAIGNSKSACIVDIGWAASGFSALRYLIEDQWQIDCKVTGLVAGSTYLHDMDIIEAQLTKDVVASYMFSQRDNREIRRDHNVKQMYSVFTEIMLRDRKSVV